MVSQFLIVGASGGIPGGERQTRMRTDAQRAPEENAQEKKGRERTQRQRTDAGLESGRHNGGERERLGGPEKPSGRRRRYTRAASRSHKEREVASTGVEAIGQTRIRWHDVP